MTNLKAFYDTNKDFNNYVERIRRNKPGVTVEEVLSNKTVEEVANYYDTGASEGSSQNNNR